MAQTDGPRGKAAGEAKVAILLATYNGAKALQEQLDSYVSQTHAPALLLVSDDGSTDATRAILAAFAQAHPDIPVTVLDVPQRGGTEFFTPAAAGA